MRRRHSLTFNPSSSPPCSRARTQSSNCTRELGERGISEAKVSMLTRAARSLLLDDGTLLCCFITTFIINIDRSRISCNKLSRLIRSRQLRLEIPTTGSQRIVALLENEERAIQVRCYHYSYLSRRCFLSRVPFNIFPARGISVTPATTQTIALFYMIALNFHFSNAYSFPSLPLSLSLSLCMCLSRKTRVKVRTMPLNSVLRPRWNLSIID
jgi:hypothetical protein